MKRTLFSTLGLLLLGTSLALAQTPTPAPGGPPAGQQVGPNYVDANGDGICDNYQTRVASGRKAGKGYGPGNGAGNRGMGPRDGTGYGPGNGTGTCTGTCNGSGQGRGGGAQHRGGSR